ncbi:MAG TPA: hypothetical protein VF198_05320 [Vicinamibacterales bacterium]
MPVALDRPDIVAERRFFAGLALVVLAIVFLGFANTYYLWPLTRATHTATGRLLPSPTPPLVHVHAVLFSGWIVLFVAQACLGARGRVGLHRRLGMAALGLVPLMVITGLATAIHGGRTGWHPGGPYPDSLGFMVAGFRDIANFTVLTGAGLLYRRRPDIHRRLMLLGTIGGLLWPAIVRVPFLAGRIVPLLTVLAALVLAPAVYDFRTRARTRWLSLGLGLAILATFPGAVVVGTSGWWRAFATWVTQ